MDEIYENHGVRFSYPANWEVSEQGQPGELSITVSSPHTAFWTLSLFLEGPDPEGIMEAVLDAFREEYDELDIYEVKATLCDQEALARDIEFVCLELLNSAWARVIRTTDYTLLVLYQANDEELDEAGAIMEEITRSLSCEGLPEDLEYPADLDDEDL